MYTYYHKYLQAFDAVATFLRQFVAILELCNRLCSAITKLRNVKAPETNHVVPDMLNLYIPESTKLLSMFWQQDGLIAFISTVLCSDVALNPYSRNSSSHQHNNTNSCLVIFCF